MARTDRTLTPFAARVRQIRMLRGWSQEQVARRGGFSSGYIGGIEAGTRGFRPKRDKVIAIAQGLEASTEERADLLRLAGYPVSSGDDMTPPFTPTFFEAVDHDPVLGPEAKKALIMTYTALTGIRPQGAG